MCQPYQGLNFQIVFVFIVAFVFVILFVFAFVINFFICICVYELCTSQVGYHVSALSGPARLLQPSTLTPALYLQIGAMHYIHCNTSVALHCKTLYSITIWLLQSLIQPPLLLFIYRLMQCITSIAIHLLHCILKHYIALLITFCLL